MSKFRHPSELNRLQRFLQARAAVRTTSRASNDGWYQDALELAFQLHIRIDGGPIRSWFHRPMDGTWEPGPELPEQAFNDAAASDTFAAALFQAAQARKAAGLGVVLHVADEFAIAELGPDHEDPSALPALRALIATEPGRVIADSTLPPDQHAWRLFPYAGTHARAFATAVTLSRRWEGFLQHLRQAGEDRNFPLRTLALSAPLCLLQALPFLLEKPLEHPHIAVFHYPFFTVLAFLGADGNLALLRTLQHRGQRRPSNLRHAASTTAAALEFANPEVLVVPLADDSAKLVAASLREVFPAPSVHLLDWSRTPFSPALGVDFPEPPAALADTAAAGTPLSNALTFSALRDEGWARQDFLPPAPESVERFPNRSEMHLLRFTRVAQLGIAAVVTAAVGWMALSIINTIRRPEWSFNPAEARALQQRMAVLGVEQQRIGHWDNLLEDRSKAWCNMELMCRLFPKGSGLLLRKFAHTVKPDTAPGQSRAGFVKEWRLSGLAREEAIEPLTALNTQEGISQAFAKVAAATGNQAFATDLPSRTLIVNLRTVENSAFKARPVEELTDTDESTYPFSFDLTITQRFEASDPMALTVTKAPRL